MRVRVRKDPMSKTYWLVEVKTLLWPFWRIVTLTCGDEAGEDAIDIAKAILNPIIIEVKA